MKFEIDTPAGPAVQSPYGPIFLADIFEADTGLGVLIWRARPIEMFVSQNAFATWNARFAGRVALSTVSRYGYRRGHIFARMTMAHRVLFAIHNGHWPTANIDHVNGERSDNRACNLRDVSQAENLRNASMSKKNTSGVTGVYWHKPTQKWQAQIESGGKNIYLGRFVDLSEATSARKAAEEARGFHDNHGRKAA